MVYQLGNLSDLDTLPLIDDTALELLHHHLQILDDNYGSNRNLTESDGGYVLYAVPETNIEEINAFFDISTHTPEWVNRYGNLCEALYLITNEFIVVVIMYITDAPTNILNEII